MKRVEGFAAGAVVGFAAPRADEAVNAVDEGDEAKVVALLFGLECEQQGGGDVALEDTVGAAGRDRPGGETRGVENYVNFLGPLDLEDTCDRSEERRVGKE